VNKILDIASDAAYLAAVFASLAAGTLLVSPSLVCSLLKEEIKIRKENN